MEPKYPNITVKLVGTDGNAWAILAKVRRALRQGGASEDVLSEFMHEACSGDYDHLLQTCMKWVEVE